MVTNCSFSLFTVRKQSGVNLFKGIIYIVRNEWSLPSSDTISTGLPSETATLQVSIENHNRALLCAEKPCRTDTTITDSPVRARATDNPVRVTQSKRQYILKEFCSLKSSEFRVWIIFESGSLEAGERSCHSDQGTAFSSSITRRRKLTALESGRFLHSQSVL